MENFKKNISTQIIDGLSENPGNYSLYYLMGKQMAERSPRQAYLCYEQAEYYCRVESDHKIIAEAKQRLRKEGVCVPGVSVIILSYNASSEIGLCLDSIRDSVSQENTEIIVVDVGSNEETLELLKQQADIKLIYAAECDSEVSAYQRGIAAAKPENDIYLLHSDTVLVPNSLFWLRMGLYEDVRVGASGSVSNSAQNYQQIEETFANPNEYLVHGMMRNIPMEYPYEKKLCLYGFSMLLKRSAFDEIGGLDTRFVVENCGFDDLCYRMIQNSYQLLVCRNSFVFHFATESPRNRVTDYQGYYMRDLSKFPEKWGFDYRYYTYERRNLLGLMDAPLQQEMRILEIGCGMGATLGYLKNKYPKAEVHGIELMEDVVQAGQKYLPNIIQGNIEQMELPYAEGYFDYIVCADVLEHLHNPDKTIRMVARYLKPSGTVIASIPNIMHYSVILELLKGKFTYRDSGILDRTHLKFFTLDEIKAMFERCGYTVDALDGSRQKVALSGEDETMYQQLIALPGVASEDQFQTYQYFVKAIKK